MTKGMKQLSTLITFAYVAAALATAQTPLTPAWTYQGRLNDAGAAANGDYDMQFELYDSATVGAKIGPTLMLDSSDPNSSPVAVVDGLFTVELDFGTAAFNGEARWLQVFVRPSGGVNYTVLSPRQPLTATPYALQTRGIFVDENNNVGIGTTSPAFPLHIQAAQPYTQYDDTGGGSSWIVGLQSPSVGFNIQELGAGTRFVINEGGSVGIGTIAPQANLHIDGSGSSAVAFQIDAPGSATGSVSIGSPAGSVGIAASANNGNRRDIRFTDGGLGLFTRNSPSRPSTGHGLFIDESGSVGIGTTTPTARLNVIGDGAAAVMRLTNGGASANTALVVGDVTGAGRAATFFGVTSNDLMRVENNGGGKAALFIATQDHAIETIETGNANALRATHTATTGVRSAIYGESQSTSGRGVQGIATSATGGSAFGVYGQSNAATSGATGVRGVATGANTTYGVSGQSFSLTGVGTYGLGRFGVQGLSNLGGFDSKGVYGQSTSTDGLGVHGEATAGSSSAGVCGSNSGGGWAGFFTGDVRITGTLLANTKNFMIDNPANPEDEYLIHTCVESDEMKNVYDGVVTLDKSGAATVELPDWFDALNGRFRYQLTCIGGYAPVYIASEIAENQFTIAGGKPGLKVSWQVTGVRIDPSADRVRKPTVVTKPDNERGLFLDPAAFGQPPEKAIGRQANLQSGQHSSTDGP